MTFGKRLRALATDHRLTDADIARALGVTEPAVNHYMNDRRQPRGRRLAMLAQMLGVSVDYLLTGHNSQATTPLDPPADRSMLGVKLSDFVQVRYVKGSIDSPMEEWGEYAFLSAWLSHLTGSPGECRLMRIAKNDMEPTLPRGAVVLIDPQRKQPNGAVFAFRIDDNLLVRRLAEVDGMVSITADNRAYSSMAATRKRIEIIGQAIWQGSILPEQ